MYDMAVPNAEPGVCAKCRGSGEYRWGPCENGKPPKFGGPCWSCKGTGKQDRSDMGRNEAYNRHKLASMGFGCGGGEAPPDGPESDSADVEDNRDPHRTCSCGSGGWKRALHDARGIFVAFVCDQCVEEKKRSYRPEIFTDPNYHHDEPL